MAHCCVQILKPKQSMSLPIRSVHIKPLPVETDTTDVLPRGKPRNPVNRKLTTRRHSPQLAPENLPRAAVSSGKSTTRRLRFLTSKSSSWFTRCPDGLVVHRSTWPENLVVIRHRTRHLGFWHLLHAPVDLARAETLLLTSPDDVITPRRQPRKQVHVSKSHVSPRHVIKHIS